MFPPAGSPPPINSFPASAVLTVGRSGKPAFNTTAAAPVLAQTIMVPSLSLPTPSKDDKPLSSTSLTTTSRRGRFGTPSGSLATCRHGDVQNRAEISPKANSLGHSRGAQGHGHRRLCPYLHHQPAPRHAARRPQGGGLYPHPHRHHLRYPRRTPWSGWMCPSRARRGRHARRVAPRSPRTLPAPPREPSRTSPREASIYAVEGLLIPPNGTTIMW